MTLHWWMHWFWITCHITYSISLSHSIPLSASSVLVSTDSPTIEEIRSLRRPIKSIDQTEQTAPLVQSSSYTLPFPDTSDTSDTSLSLGASLSQLYRSKTTARPEKIPVPCTNDSATPNNSTLCNKSAVPLSNLNMNTTQIQAETETISTSTVSSSSISTSTTQVLNVSKDQVNSTLASVIVTKELVSVKEKVLSSDQSQSSNLSPVSITGISFAVIIIAALVGATSFVIYRRRYLNKPQTLNDKCSNPDSSGYIDDSTMRENSEEMYSLDNDSFLNSLEAMTIQNYWTDSVKHTKL